MSAYPPGWIEIHCNDCGKPIGAYNADFPQPVMSYNCIPCKKTTWIEPKIRR